MVWSGEAKRQENMNKLNVQINFKLMSLQGCCLKSLFIYNTCKIHMIMSITIPVVSLKLEKEIHIKQDIFL